MDKKIDRLKRQQQRKWRKAAVSILSLHHNLVIVLSFLMVVVFGSLWLFMDQKLESQLLKNIRSYGYSITHYAATDLRPLILSEEKNSQKQYLRRLTDHPLILTAHLFDHQGTLLAESVATNQGDTNHVSLNDFDTLTLLEDLYFDGNSIGILQIKMDRTKQEKPVQELLESIAIIIVFTMMLAILVAWLASRRLTKPLRQLLNLPIDVPQLEAIEKLDVASELKLMLESSSTVSGAPAPVSNAEASGIHRLLSVDSVTEIGEVIILKLYLCDLAKWLKPDSGSPNVELLRKLDRLLIVTVHSQQGHLINFDGITAQACFGLDGNLKAAAFRAASCSLLLKQLLDEMSLLPKICLRKEKRLLLRHMKRTPIAIPLHTTDDDPTSLFSDTNLWILLHKSLYNDHLLLEQIRLKQHDEDWKTIRETRPSAQSMMERQLTWIRHLLSQKQT